MNEASLPLSGGCLCGKVRFEISAAPVMSLACHCRGCQKLTASAFSLSLTIPTSGFEIVEGSPVKGALHKPDGRYWFCDWRKGWLYTEPPPEFGFVNVRTMLLEEPEGWEPLVEVWTSEKLSWAETPARHSYPENPPMEEFEALASEYARTASGAAS